MATEPRAGSVIELSDGDAPSLGVVLEAGKSLKVLREGGKVAQASLKAVSSDELDRWDVGAGQATLLARLTALAQKLAARVEAAKVSEAWELLYEDGGELSPQDLADLLWGEAGPLERVALARALRREPMYFEARKELYRPRNEKQVAELRRQHEAEQAAQTAPPLRRVGARDLGAGQQAREPPRAPPPLGRRDGGPRATRPRPAHRGVRPAGRRVRAHQAGRVPARTPRSRASPQPPRQALGAGL